MCIYIFEGRALMIKNRLDEKTSGVSNIEMAVMCNMYGITDDMLGERKSINESDNIKDTVSVSGYDMADMYDLLKNK
jgi:hypothetical protein